MATRTLARPSPHADLHPGQAALSRSASLIPPPFLARLRGIVLAGLLLLQLLGTACRSTAQDKQETPPPKPKRLIEMIDLRNEGVPFCFDAAYSPDGRRIAIAGLNLLVIDAATYKEEHRTKVEMNARVVAWSPNGKWLAHSSPYGGEGDDIRILAVGTWEEEALRLDRGQGPIRGTDRTMKGEAFDLEFSPDSSLLAACGENGKAEVWVIPSGERKYSFEGDYLRVISVSFSPDGKRLLYAGARYAQPGLALLRELSSGAILFSAESVRARLDATGKYILGSAPADLLPSNGDPQSYWRAASWFSNGSGSFGQPKLARGDPGAIGGSRYGSVAAYGSTNGHVWLWSRETREPIEDFKKFNPNRGHHYGHSSGISAVSFSPDGKRLMTASGDGLIIFWDVSDLTQTEAK